MTTPTTLSTIPGEINANGTINDLTGINGGTNYGTTASVSGNVVNPGVAGVLGFWDVQITPSTITKVYDVLTQMGRKIAGVNIVTKTGSNELLRPVYERGLVLDTHLKSWGSCNSTYRILMDYTPINDRSFNPLTGNIESQFTLRNQSSTFGIIDTSDTLFTCAETGLGDTSWIDYGLIAFTHSGMTRCLEAKAFMGLTTDAKLAVIGSLMGNDPDLIDLVVLKDNTGMNPPVISRKVMTGKWFVLRVSGDFQLKGLEFSGEIGGKR